MEEINCCFQRDRRWFRYRACAIIPRGDSILMATNPGVDYLYSVGGGVHHGETAEEAVRREVLEETGIAMEVDRLAAVHENLFRGIMDDPDLICHEIALYFLMKPSDLNGIHASGVSMDGMPEHLVWVPAKDFGKGNIYPSFLPQALSHAGVLHVVTRN